MVLARKIARDDILNQVPPANDTDSGQVVKFNFKPARFNSGLVLVAFFSGLSLIVSTWLSLTSINDRQSNLYQPPLQGFMFWLIMNLMVFFMGLAAAFQRIHIDPTKRHIHYANISTCHLWRSVDPSQVTFIYFAGWESSSRGIVSHLCLSLAGSKNFWGGAPKADLIDSNFTGTPIALSPQFEAVVRFICLVNPTVKLSPKLEKYRKSDDV